MPRPIESLVSGQGNLIGPDGPPGPAGATGPQGPAGPAAARPVTHGDTVSGAVTNYDVSALGFGDVLSWTCSSAVTLNSFTAREIGFRFTLFLGNNPFVLTAKDNAGNSVNSIKTPKNVDYLMGEDEGVDILYDGTRWRFIDVANPEGSGTIITNGSITETFSGGSGVSITSSNTNANIGDYGWNYIVSGTTTGNSCAPLAGVVGATGIRRIISPSTLLASANIYLGSNTIGLFDPAGWAECTFRARVDTTVITNASNTVYLANAVSNSLGTGDSAGFLALLAGSGSSPNFQTRTSQSSAGNSTKNTGVAIDGNFHNFRIVRVSSTQLDFYIDGVLKTSHSVALGDGIPTLSLIPIFNSVGGGSSTHIDCDQFNYISQ